MYFALLVTHYKVKREDKINDMVIHKRMVSQWLFLFGCYAKLRYRTRSHENTKESQKHIGSVVEPTRGRAIIINERERIAISPKGSKKAVSHCEESPLGIIALETDF